MINRGILIAIVDSNLEATRAFTGLRITDKTPAQLVDEWDEKDKVFDDPYPEVLDDNEPGDYDEEGLDGDMV